MLKLSLHIVAAYVQIFAKVGQSEPLIVTAEEKDGKAIVYIKGFIHEWTRASAIELEAQVLALKDAGYEDATVYINSKGGQTTEASEIVNVLRLFTGKLTAVCGSIVASAATYILCKLDEVHVRPNTQYMWHKPKAVIQGTADEIEASLKMVRDAEAHYLKTYATKTGKSEDDLSAQWDKGDQWMLGKEIVTEGFGDVLMEEKAKITAQDVSTLTACGAPVIPEVTAVIEPEPNSNNQNREMKIDPLSIGLEANATDDAIQARIVELNKKAGEVDALKAEKEQKEADALEAEIDEILTTAINVDKKFTADLKPKFENILKADLENGKAIIAGLTSMTKLSSQTTTSSSTDATRVDWTYADWKQKDPEGLQAMHENETEKFDKLFEKHTNA